VEIAILSAVAPIREYTFMPNESTAQKVREWYQTYHARKGIGRNDLLRDPGVLLQTLAFDVSITYALRSTNLDRATARVLDVGCGPGGSLFHLLRLGFQPSRMYGTDILEEWVAVCRGRFPAMNLTCGDASELQFPDHAFDLVSEAGVFFQTTNESLARGIASEIVRVTKPGGYILLVEWRYSKPGDPGSIGLSKKRAVRLFDAGSRCRFLGAYKGALIPPIGRLLSRIIPSAYFMVAVLCPLLVGQVAYLLRKEACCALH
jgi:SAM-dependent methyltransferase